MKHGVQSPVALPPVPPVPLLDPVLLAPPIPLEVVVPLEVWWVRAPVPPVLPVLDPQETETIATAAPVARRSARALTKRFIIPPWSRDAPVTARH